MFTALAFAGLIYTVLLQRDQLALQQQEIVESGKTQEQLVAKQISAQQELFERQKSFQEEQRLKRVEHEIKLEQLRQDYEKVAEQLRKAREEQGNNQFVKNVLSAIRRELEALGEIYDRGIGAQLTPLKDGQIFRVRLALTEDWFTVFNATAVHLGRVPADISRRIISIYAVMKAQIEEFRINNDYLAAFADLEFELKERPHETVLKQRHEAIRVSLVAQAIKLRAMQELFKELVPEFYALLDQHDVG